MIAKEIGTDWKILTQSVSQTIRLFLVVFIWGAFAGGKRTDKCKVAYSQACVSNDKIRRCSVSTHPGTSTKRTRSLNVVCAMGVDPGRAKRMVDQALRVREAVWPVLADHKTIEKITCLALKAGMNCEAPTMSRRERDEGANCYWRVTYRSLKVRRIKIENLGGWMRAKSNSPLNAMFRI